MLDILLKNFYQSVQKQRQEGKREKKKSKRKAIAKIFALHANAKWSNTLKQFMSNS